MAILLAVPRFVADPIAAVRLLGFVDRVVRDWRRGCDSVMMRDCERIKGLSV